MPNIPPEYLNKLQYSIGITDPAGSRWCRILDSFGAYLPVAIYRCPCKQEVHLAKHPLGGRIIHIGQCRGCKTVYWADVK